MTAPDGPGADPEARVRTLVADAVEGIPGESPADRLARLEAAHRSLRDLLDDPGAAGGAGNGRDGGSAGA